MKIKKIKSQGEFCYPATIAAAVKDANFTKDDSPMTLGEINLYLNNKDGNLNLLNTTTKTDLVSAINELKQNIDNSDNSYVLSMNDDGYVQCIKNSTDEGLTIDDNGIVSLI